MRAMTRRFLIMLLITVPACEGSRGVTRSKYADLAPPILMLLKAAHQTEFPLTREFLLDSASALFIARCAEVERPTPLRDLIRMDCVPHAWSIACTGLLIDNNSHVPGCNK